MEGWRLHEAIGQNETEQKNRIMIVVIKHLMLYNGLEEIVGFEADTQTVLRDSSACLSNKTPCSRAENIRICYIAQSFRAFSRRKDIMEMQDPFAELIGMFEGPSQVNHDDVYD